MNIGFYIFGVPDGFNLFQGNADDTSYFQSFYDGSKENTKFTIHRKSNGQISYSYLRYKIFSSEGRAGAFFGMSIVFNGEYCYDAAKLYRLLDTVYRDIIIKNKILLEEISGNSNVQAKFLIHSFKEQEAEVRNIENVILKNIENKFTNDIHGIDSSFRPGKPNLVRKLNVNKSNEAILDALRDYLWVSISPEYPEEVIDEISEEGKKALLDTSDQIKNEIIKYSIKGLSENIDVDRNISTLGGTIKEIQETIQRYIKNQPELDDIEEKYKEIQTQLNILNVAIKNKSSKEKNIINSDDRKKGKKEEQEKGNAGNPKQENQPARKSFLGKIKMPLKIKWIIGIIMMGIVLFAVLKLMLFNGDIAEQPNNCPECVTYLENFRKYLSQNKFEESRNELNKVSEKGIGISDYQQELNRAAINYFIEQSQVEFNKTETQKLPKIDCYNAAIKKLNNAQGFDSKKEIEAIKEDYKKRTITYYENEIDNVKNKSDKSKYAGIIKELDPNNQKANNLIANDDRTNVQDVYSKQNISNQNSENIIILISKCDVNYQNPKVVNASEQFTVGDKLIITAKQGNKDATDESWKLEGNENKVIEVNRLKNPIRVELKKAGSVKLTYKDQSCTLNIRR